MNDATIRVLIAAVLLGALGVAFGGVGADRTGGGVLLLVLAGVLLVVGLIGYVTGGKRRS